jgi:hypothetical protein
MDPTRRDLIGAGLLAAILVGLIVVLFVGSLGERDRMEEQGAAAHHGASVVRPY